MSGVWGPARPLGRPRAAYLSDLHVTPGAGVDRRPTVIGGRHVFRSSDQGGTWVNMTSDLPDVPVNAIETNPRRPDRVWVATDIGVFQSKDRGASWSCFGRGLPRALAVDLASTPGCASFASVPEAGASLENRRLPERMRHRAANAMIHASGGRMRNGTRARAWLATVFAVVG